jgi:hypothetical protein
MTKIEVIKALRKRIDWQVGNCRPSKEIAKTAEIVLITAQELLDKERSDILFERLAVKLRELEG